MAKFHYFLILLFSCFSSYGSSLSGTVTGDGLPLQGATVHAQDTNTSIEVTTQTDINGDYTIQLSPGTYEVWADAPSNANYGSSPTANIVLGTDPIFYDISFISPPNPTYNVSGYVLDQHGLPVTTSQYHQVTLENSANRYTIDVNPDGSYSGDVESGTYDVEIYFSEDNSSSMSYRGSHGQITISNHDVIQDYMLEMYTLDVSVVDTNGLAVPNAEVFINTSPYIFGNDDHTDTNGHLSLHALAHNNYSVMVFPPVNSGLANGGVSSVDVTNDQTVQVTLQPLPQRFNVSGYVLDQHGLPVTTSQYHQVTLENSANRYTIDVNPDGSYSGDVESGTYDVEIYFSEDNSSSMSYRGSHGQITISNHDVIQDYMLEMYTLDVSVVDTNGLAVPNAEVFINTSPYIFGNDDHTDTNGHLSLHALAHNNYSVMVFPPVNSGLANGGVSSVDVTNDQTVQVTLQPQPQRFNVSGYVLDQDGLPVSNVVELWFENVNSSYFINTNPDGSYSGDVEPGTYDVEIYFSEDNSSSMSYRGSHGQITISNHDVIQDYMLEMYTLDVSVVDTNGLAVPNAEVFINTSPYIFGNDDHTDTNGHLSLRALAHNNYSVMVFPPVNSGLVIGELNSVDVTGDRTVQVILQRVIIFSSGF